MISSMHENTNEKLQQALARVAKLEQELNDRDRQLEVVITDHDQDIVDMRRSFEVEMFKKPPLSSIVRGSIDFTANDATNENCPNCVETRKQLRLYQKQWNEISKNFRQVPHLLEGMITRTDNLVCNITKYSNRK